jgi:hypothetical protein
MDSWNYFLLQMAKEYNISIDMARIIFEGKPK